MNSGTVMPIWLQPAFEVSDDTPTWLIDYRKHHRDVFLKEGLPTQKNERFKYTDLSFLAKHSFEPSTDTTNHSLEKMVEAHRLQSDSILIVLVNGRLEKSYFDLTALPNGVILTDMATAVNSHAEQVKAAWPKTICATKHPFAAFNAAMTFDGLFLSIPKDCMIKQPIHLLSIATGKQSFIAHPHHLILVGENSQVNFVEEHVSLNSEAYMMNILQHIRLSQNASIKLTKLQHDGERAFHMANTMVEQAEGSRADFVTVSRGGHFSRADLTIHLMGKSAACDTAGFYHLKNDDQYTDHHVDVYHSVASTQSEMLYKGIVDKKSRAVFNGKLYVEKDATKITAYQGSHHLLLSNNAEIYTKPELEIYADDVKCKHGATTGQIDQEALFYLQSRGIPQAEAIRMLLNSFAEEIFSKVSEGAVRDKLKHYFSLGE